MQLYSQIIFPRLLDWTMTGSPFAAYRQTLLAEVKGDVLEIGFGTGLNLAYYPPTIKQLTAIDVNPGMNRLAQKRIQASAIDVRGQTLDAETLPMADEQFDSVISTWTLCSICDVDQALQEIHRVLKPNGRFFFIEHGLSNEPKVQVWQNRLTPFQKVIADGCHLNRNIRELVEQQFKLLTLKEFYMEQLPRIGGYMYQGVATK